MEPEVLTVIGLSIVVVAAAVFFYAPAVLGESAVKLHKFYELYIDWIIAMTGAAIALVILALLVQRFFATYDGQYVYYSAAAFLYLVRMGLSLLDAIGTDGKIYLLATFAHLLDVLILGLVLKGLLQGGERAW